jgi:hypothetical protein
MNYIQTSHKQIWAPTQIQGTPIQQVQNLNLKKKHKKET